MKIKKSDEADSMTLTFSKGVFERSPEDHHASLVKKRVKSSFALHFNIKCDIALENNCRSVTIKTRLKTSKDLNQAATKGEFVGAV